MKKGLSVLLIAAAIFGFYGGAVSLNDILACKDYWEVEGEKSTADMNKLEDGLNQLKDNEKAYLDGIEAVADGEKQLADGEAELAKGEAKLADGEAQYAKGLADYEAAPAKLAAGKAKLDAGEAKLADGYAQYEKGESDLEAGKKAVAQGEKDLAAGRAAIEAGEEQLEDLGALIDGINLVLGGYPEFRNGYERLRDKKAEILGMVPGMSGTLANIQALLTKYGQTAALKELANATSKLGAEAKTPKSTTNKSFENVNDGLTSLISVLNATKPILTKIDNEVTGIRDGAVTADGKTLAQLQALLTTDDLKLGMAIARQMGATDEQIAQMAQNTPDVLIGYGQAAKNEIMSGLGSTLSGKAADLTQLVGSLDPDDSGKLSSAMGNIASGNAAKTATGIGQLRDVLGNVHTAIGTLQTMLDQYLNSSEGLPAWTAGYAQLNGSDTKSQLTTLSGGVAKIIGGVMLSGNNELIDGMNKAAKAFGFAPTDYAPVQTSQLMKDLNDRGDSGSWMNSFYTHANQVTGAFSAVLPSLNKKAEDGKAELEAGKQALKEGEAELEAGKQAVAEGEAKLAAARKQLEEGEVTLANGKSEYAQGLADYMAAPAKLADARVQLADGRQQLADGRQALADGRKELADGKSKLAEYEDGEQQVRDGLATLMATEPSGGLKSILDRRNGDDKFDDANGHLGLDEGLEAVKVGREYQADSGVLITEEITARAVGTAAGLCAGILAVLAAILGWLKKNKGAGISAALSAVAAGVGAAYYSNAGTEFSDIAGSTIGSTAVMAFGVLAAVAAVYAIVNFAAKKEA